MNANDARELASKYLAPDEIEMNLALVNGEIEKAAKEGKFKLRITGVLRKLVPEVKKVLKERGFKVAVYRENSIDGVRFSGEMEIEW